MSQEQNKAQVISDFFFCAMVTAIEKVHNNSVVQQKKRTIRLQISMKTKQHFSNVVIFVSKDPFSELN